MPNPRKMTIQDLRRELGASRHENARLRKLLIEEEKKCANLNGAVTELALQRLEAQKIVKAAAWAVFVSELRLALLEVG